MEHFWSAIDIGVTHIVAGVAGWLLFGHVIEPWMARIKRQKQLLDLSWLFPITTENPELHFKCSLKPQLDFMFAEQGTDIFSQFFGRNPPTYRKYVHSAEVLALQKITEWLSTRGVKLLPDAFYGQTERSTHLLLIGSDSNVEMSKTILEKMKNSIDYQRFEDKHKCFVYGNTRYECRHSDSPSPDGIKRVTQDCGVIVRTTLSDGKIVLLLAGIHMHGTLAAAEVAMNPAFHRRVLQNRYANFAQIVRVKVLENGTSIDRTSLEEWEQLPFVKLD